MLGSPNVSLLPHDHPPSQNIPVTGAVPYVIVDFGISQPALITGNDHVKGETVTRCLLAWQP